MLLEVQGIGGGDLITLGDGSSAQTAASQIPHDLVVDRLYIHGDADKGQKRGIALNSASTSIPSSYISDIKAGGPGFSGDLRLEWTWPVRDHQQLPRGRRRERDVRRQRSQRPESRACRHHGRPITYVDQARCRGGRRRWSVKNLIELKNARRVMIARQHRSRTTGMAAQPGFAIVFTVRNQDGKCPWCQVDHVTFEQNIVRHIAARHQDSGLGQQPPEPADAGDPRFGTTCSTTSTARYWGGNGYFLAMTDGARDITVDHNTVVQVNALGDRADRRSARARFRVHEQPVDIRQLRNRRHRPRFRQQCHRRILAGFRYLAERHRGSAGRATIPRTTAFLPPRSSRRSSCPTSASTIASSRPARGAALGPTAWISVHRS